MRYMYIYIYTFHILRTQNAATDPVFCNSFGYRIQLFLDDSNPKSNKNMALYYEICRLLDDFYI